jgi:serine/threonine protein kinase/Tol biopolymer transport system component
MLAPGNRLGPYEVVALIGQGGMGEVYSATDTNLKRIVAIKVLPAVVAADGDRLARFQREAEVLAALNHPNIASIYGLERSGAITGLVMELVEGPTLADRIKSGPIPIDEAVTIATQIADALRAAHERSIIHRDLKPANVKVRDDGTVKVLDFGLAKALEPAAGPDLDAPTITSPAMTARGVILGTAAYMSPEQARGRAVDRQTDIWAFGCVLYEMLTARRPFDGDDVTETLANVLKVEPDWRRLSPSTPPSLLRLLRRSLDKDPRRRTADLADARLELDDARAERRQAPDQPARSRFPRRERWWAVATAIAVLVAGAMAAVAFRKVERDARPVRFEYSPPAGEMIDLGEPLSPDGRTVAFVTISQGVSRIRVRSLDSDDSRVLAGTEGATRPFWSPDSQYIAYFVKGDLKKVAIGGGAPVHLATGPFRDGDWSAGGVILVGGQFGRPLLRVPDVGGSPTPETLLDTGDISHDYPEFLPGGRHYLYLARDKVTLRRRAYIGTLGSTERRIIAGITSGVRYSETGHLLSIANDILMAQPFDLDRLQPTGERFPVVSELAGTSVPVFSTSANGSLAFIREYSAETELIWCARDGTRGGVAGPAEVYGAPRLSPNGRSVVFGRSGGAWVLDLKRGVPSKITSDPATGATPVWSPDGLKVAFASNRNGGFGLYASTVGAVGAEQLLRKFSAEVVLTDWSRGNFIAYTDSGDLWALSLDSGEPVRVTTTSVLESDGQFSPNGGWIAYVSQEPTGVTRLGEGDVFVQSFPRPGHKLQVSTGGGALPRWSHDGKELFYVAPGGQLVAVSVALRGASLALGPATPLFQVPLDPTRSRYSVADGGRFLVQVPLSPRAVAVIENWTALKRPAPVR